MECVHIIDDDCVYRTVITEIVRSLGFSTMEFSSGEKYLSYMRTPEYKTPMLIFSDMNMPGLNGLVMLREVLRFFPEIPCYLFSGNTAQFEQVDLSSDAIKEVLEKPVCFKKVRAILHSLHPMQCNIP